MGSPRIAKDLASANAGELLHVDAQGRVRSPLRVRSTQAIFWGVIAALLTAEAVLGYGLLGVPGLGVAFALTLLVGWRVSKQRALMLASNAAAEKRYDEADRRYAALARSRLLPRLFRPVAKAQRAVVKEKAGDLEAALRLNLEAQKLFGQSRHAQARLTLLQEVRLLARLGRLSEAKARHAELGEGPEGELFRLHDYTLELYLAFLEGSHDLSDDELHERASFALEINLASPLIALLAWAFDQRDDADMTELLRETALDRDVDGAAQRYPALFDWLEGSADGAEAPRERVRARVVDDPLEDEALEHVDDEALRSAARRRRR